MSFDFEKFAQDYNIPYKTASNGWMASNCPFFGCKQTGWKLGFNNKSNVFNCFRCGTHSVREYIHDVLNISWQEVNLLYKEYNNIFIGSGLQIPEERPHHLEFPKGLKSLNSIARKYLEDRKFDSYELENKYGLLSLDHTCDNPNRIFIPINFFGKTVSYTTRSYSPFINDSERYWSCPLNQEIIPHKSICYNWDNCKGNNLAIVEGPFDAIRLGDNACCTFGLQFCNSQINLLKQKKNIFVIYDPETRAQQKAKELAMALSLFDISCENIFLETDCDVGDLDENQIKYLKKELDL